jgi:hypothetical protein
LALRIAAASIGAVMAAHPASAPRLRSDIRVEPSSIELQV